MSCKSLTYVFSVMNISRHTICNFDIDAVPPFPLGMVGVMLSEDGVFGIGRFKTSKESCWSLSPLLSLLLLLLSFNSVMDSFNSVMDCAAKSSSVKVFSNEKLDSSMATLCRSGDCEISTLSFTVVSFDLSGDFTGSMVSLLILNISFKSSLEKEVAVGVTMVLKRSPCESW